jgi:anion-transporting  ArsA/GET3 family ATPase
VLRRLAKFVGNQFLDDVGAFLLDFQGVLAGFLARAEEIDRLLRSRDVSFLLVLAPEVAAVDEALFFSARLREGGIPLGTFVANRVHPRPGLADRDEIAARLAAQPSLAGLPRADVDDAARRLAALAVASTALHESERRELARLAASVPGVPITEVPLLDHDVDNLAELRTVGDYLANGVAS